MIPHSCPTIDASSACLRCGQIAMGPQVEKFERAFAKQSGMRDAAAVSSGTAALHLALLALGVKKGDEVIIPTHVCTALLNAAHYVGATPVLVDVQAADANICALDVSRKISRRTKAIIVPHMFGSPADLSSLLRFGVPLIEDCAQALGARYAGRLVGTFGKISVFSFYATKMMATGEGGMVVSNDRRLMSRVRDLLSYDNKPDYKVRFNYKMTDVGASLGCVQLKKLNMFIARRRQIAKFYDKALKDLPCVLPLRGKDIDPVFYRYVIGIKGSADKFVTAMKKKGVCCERPLFRPLHQYMKMKGFSVSDQWMASSVSLPIYPTMTHGQAERVVRGVRCLLTHKGIKI
jgi:perosamine synthetase